MRNACLMASVYKNEECMLDGDVEYNCEVKCIGMCSRFSNS